MRQAPVLHQETRLSLTPLSSSQILHINIGNPQQSLFSVGRKRNFDQISDLDEESYARKYLATEASVFFRHGTRSPRSFLWRVLDDGKVLEIQSVDLVRDLKGAVNKESKLIFRLAFTDSIVRGGVAFADSEDTDALDCFVLTSAKELFTVTLKKDLLTRDSAPKDFDSSTCFRKYVPSALVHRHPYRFVAISSLELLLSLHDGGFMRLVRQKNETGAQWRESIFSEHSWGTTLRGMITLKRQQTIRFGEIDLWPSAVAAMVASPDGRLIWTVNLEHEVKVWNSKTGKVVYVMDLLDEKVEEDATKAPRFLMGAEQGTLIQLVSVSPSAKSSRSIVKADVDPAVSSYLVVHSPQEHEFKFFTVTLHSSEEGEVLQLEDIHPNLKLIPPMDDLLGSNVWHLEEFFVLPGPGWHDSRIWLRARSGPICRTFTLAFDLLGTKSRSAATLAKVWSNGWSVVDSGRKTNDRLKDCPDFPGQLERVGDLVPSISEKWIAFLFRPGRFSTASLESAVHIYRKARGLPASSVKGINGPELALKQRLTQAIESKILLSRLPNELPNYHKYVTDIQAQWKIFHSLLSHLHNKRNASLSLSIDYHNNLAWAVFSDLAAPIREIGSAERLSLNEHLLPDDQLALIDENLAGYVFAGDADLMVSSIMATAKEFRSSLSPEFRDRFARATISEALTLDVGNTESSLHRLQAMYDEHHFSAEVVDDDFNALTEAAENFGGLGSLETSSFLAVFDQLDELDEKLHGKNIEKWLCKYGDRVTIEIVLEFTESAREILLDMLNLIVFMLGDLDSAELHADFVSGAGELLEAAAVRLKHHELIIWLADTIVQAPQEIDTAKSDLVKIESQHDTPSEPTEGIPLLLRLFIAGWKSTSTAGQSLPQLLTRWSHAWMDELDLSKQWNDITAYIFAYLVKRELYGLATDFTKFLASGENSTSWLYYLEGRHALAISDLNRASLKFRAAVNDMAVVRGIASVDRAHLLSPEEQTYFGSGPSRYFQHIAALYESRRLFSYVADFATLALIRCDEDSDLSSSLANIDKRKADTSSPVANRIEDTMEEIRILKLRERTADIRHRLFNALVQTGRFKEAWIWLIHFGETRKSSLGTWIKKVVEAEAVEVLLEVTMDNPGDVLSQEMDAVLLGLAKKSLSMGSGVPYYQILYAYRTQQSNFRGAAQILYEQLDRLRTQPQYFHNTDDDALIEAYVLLINTMACCGEEDAWLLAEPSDSAVGKRKLVTLADVRSEYTTELDRRSDVLMGRFPLVGNDEMDIL